MRVGLQEVNWQGGQSIGYRKFQTIIMLIRIGPLEVRQYQNVQSTNQTQQYQQQAPDRLSTPLVSSGVYA